MDTQATAKVSAASPEQAQQAQPEQGLLAHFRQLQPEERVRLASLKQQDLSVRKIALALERSPATISRELRRNTTQQWGYASQLAQKLSQTRRAESYENRPKMDKPEVRQEVLERLRRYWSPQQIAKDLKRSHPEDSQRQVCAETIYAAIYAYPKGELRKELLSCLRFANSKRKKRSAGQDRRGKLRGMLSIHMRPPEVEDRLVPGHFEGDFIKGKANQSAVGVLVERTTRLVVLARMQDCTAESALEGFALKLAQIPQPLRKTLTYDQGKEMALHAQLCERVGLQVFFCDPHSPWQRGSCENTNGLLRQYLPKGTDLSVYTQEQLDQIALSLNTRPRKTLEGMTPLEAFTALIAQTEITAPQTG